MNENFIKYIKKHREDFDFVEKPDVDKLWNEFAYKRQQSNTKDIFIAVGFLLVLVICSIIAPRFIVDKTSNWTIENLQELDPELASYQTLMIESIEEQEDLLNKLSIDQKDYQDIQISLQQLDEITRRYKEDLKQDSNNRKIIKALLKCAKQRVRLYELLLYKYELKKYQDELKLQS